MFRIAYQGLERDAIRELPAAAQNVFERSLSKRPGERYATCGEMVETLASALLRTAPAPTRMADAAEFAAANSPAPAPAPARGGSSWAARHISREAFKYFGVTFVLCALVLAGVIYFLLPKAPPKPVPVAPAVSQPVPGLSPAKSAPAQPASAQPKPDIKSAAKGHAKKKADPEVDLKPAEPKIIRP
jgi:hypothetical protein